MHDLTMVVSNTTQHEHDNTLFTAARARPASGASSQLPDRLLKLGGRVRGHLMYFSTRFFSPSATTEEQQQPIANTEIQK
jgi:hypothetical protein